MITHLWNNRTNIINNYLQIIKNYLPDISILILLFTFIVIYAYLRYTGFKLKTKIESLSNTPNVLSTLSWDSNPMSMDSTVLETFTSVNVDGTLGVSSTESITQLYITIEGQQILTDIIKNTYLSKFNQPNIQARGFDTMAEMVRSYNKALIPITDKEKYNTSLKINKYIDLLNNNHKKYIKSCLPKIQICKGAKWLEAGMPHTHDNCIIMRPDWFDSQFMESTFIHELIHVIQRKYPSKWNELYNAWGFMQATELTGLESYLNINRINPDGMDINWIWYSVNENKYYWIGAVYKSISPSSLMDINYLAIPIIKVSSENTFKYIGTTPNKLNMFHEFKNYFGIDQNHYHPNEIAAQFAEYYFSNNNNNITHPGYKVFDKWMTNFILNN